MNKQFAVILAVVIIAFGGLIWFSKNKKANAPSSDTVAASNHVEGGGKKKVTLLEYGDFQCPACGQYYPLVEQVKQKYHDDIFFQFRNYPLVQIHQNAMIGHRAAEAADMQGKFWEMYNMLYQNQQTWSTAKNPTQVINSYAQQLGLKADKFAADFSSEKVNSIINADIKAGQAIGAQATPTFVLDGKKIESPPPSVEGFSKLIDKAIADKNGQ